MNNLTEKFKEEKQFIEEQGSKKYVTGAIATYAVIAVSPLFYLKSDNKFFDFFSKAVSITLAAQILTLPVTLTFTSQISLISLVANIIASIFTIIIYPISFIAMILPFNFIVGLSEIAVVLMYSVIELLHRGDVFIYTFINTDTAIIISSFLSILLFLITIERKNRIIRKEIKKNRTIKE